MQAIGAFLDTQPFIALFVVIGLGYALGRVRIGGFSLGIGAVLFVGLAVMIVAAVANIWLQMPALYLALSAMGVVIFSAFILYDLKRIIDGGETNYVTATLSVYLSVYNLFSSLLHLLTALGGGDD